MIHPVLPFTVLMTVYFLGQSDHPFAHGLTLFAVAFCFGLYYLLEAKRT